MPLKFNILIVDDEKYMAEALKELLEMNGYIADIAINAKDAIEKYKIKEYDLVLTDILMPGMSGVELLKKLKEINPDVNVIMITGYASIETAIESMKFGADDYFTKPFKNIEILQAIKKIFEKKEILYRTDILKQEILRKEVPQIVGQSKGIQKIISDISKVANSDTSILITGETGTGKEVVARAIHNLSSRKNEPFIPINCASIPTELLESEFFGHEKGAFSGAVTRKYGLFEVANNGTLFLDEISDLPLFLQPKILRTVETKKLRRIGGIQEINIDIRIISATNKDIKKEIEEGRFRDDLYFRINTFTILIPPLRERKDDIPLLVENYIRKKGKEIKLQDNILSALKSYNWPGNIRELENVIERMILISDGKTFQMKHLPAEIQKSYNKQINIPIDELKTLYDIEKDHILKVYNACHFDKEKTAKLLGIGLKTLYRKLKEYEIK